MFYDLCKIVGRRARRLVAGAWLLSAIFSLPMVILYEEQVIQGNIENSLTNSELN